MSRYILFLCIIWLQHQAAGQQHTYPAIPDTNDNKMAFYNVRVRNVIKTNPLMMLWGPVPLTSEYRIMNEIVTGQKQSSQIGFSYFGKSLLLVVASMDTSLSNSGVQTLQIEGFRFQLQHKFYLTKHFAPRGFYVSPHLSYSSVKFGTNLSNQIFLRATAFQLNALAGFQAIKRSFAFDWYFGMGYRQKHWYEVTSPTRVQTIQNPIALPWSDWPVGLVLGFNLGAAF